MTDQPSATEPTADPPLTVAGVREAFIAEALGPIQRRVSPPPRFSKALPQLEVVITGDAPGRQGGWCATNGLTDPVVDRNPPGTPETEFLMGLGYELALLPEPGGWRWAVGTLYDLVRYVLETGQDLKAGDTLDFGESVSPGSQLQGLVFAPPRAFQGIETLPGGIYGWLLVHAVSREELNFGKDHGTMALVELLYRTGAAPRSSAKRSTVLDPKNQVIIDAVITRAKNASNPNSP